MRPHRKKIIDIASAIVLLSLVVLDGMIWRIIIAPDVDTESIYFLSMPQGDSALLVLPKNVTVLTDAGPDATIVDDLQKIVPSDNVSYIDLAIISYPQSVDYEGYQYLLAHDDVGAFLYNGRSDDLHSAAWRQLMDTISTKHIPLITLGAGDCVRYAKDEIDILSPSAMFARSAEPSDTGIVQRVITPGFSVLLAADIGVNVEDALLARGDGARMNLGANILKAPFPGLGTSAGDAFLRAVAPRTIVITPGVKNTESQPTKAMLAHIASSTNAAIVFTGHGSFLLYNK